MYDIVGKRNWYFAFSALLTIPGLIFILLGGLRPSIDFTGGTVWQVRFSDRPSVEDVRAEVASLGHPDAQVSALDDGFVSIRTEPIGLLPPPAEAPLVSPEATLEPGESPLAEESPSPDESAAVDASPEASPEEASPDETLEASPSASEGAVLEPDPSPSVAPEAESTAFSDLRDAMELRFGIAETRQLTTVGPIIGAELIRSSIVLIVVGELFILGYLWLRFGFRYGTAAIAALLHDVILVVGFFAIAGFFLGFEFDALFVTALLTVIGFSVHDTIVVFDRIRENRIRHAGEPFGAIVNHSILQTAGRSIATSLTVVVTLLALLLLGPSSIRSFTLALLIGVVSGTYSSIFNASQLLVAWDEWSARRKARAGIRPRPARASR